jgi:colanic acid/amylovoran biosynthesis protein
MHIVIVNAHWNNRGDEAAHRALWGELRTRYPQSRLTILFKDKKPITWFPSMPDVAYDSCQFKAPSWDIWLTVLTRGFTGRDPVLKKMVRIVKTADLIIYSPGGSVINDRFYWSKQMEYMTPFLCARLYRIPMVVAAPSMGPYNTRPRRRLRRWLLRTPRVFCVREELSRQYLNSIGVSDNVHVTMDLAFLDEVDTNAAERQLDDYPELRAFLETHSRVVGITISDFRWHVKLGKDTELTDRIETTFRQMIQALADRGYGILLIPQLFGNQNDYTDLMQYAGPSVHVMSDQPDTYLQQYVISQLYAVIGMRYHSNIFAAKMGTPFVAVVYEEKMAGFLELAGLGEYAVPLEHLSFQSIHEVFQAVEQHHRDLRESMRTNLPEWRRRAKCTLEFFPDIP